MCSLQITSLYAELTFVTHLTRFERIFYNEVCVCR